VVVLRDNAAVLTARAAHHDNRVRTLPHIAHCSVAPEIDDSLKSHRRCPARKSALPRAEIGAAPRKSALPRAEIGAAPRKSALPRGNRRCPARKSALPRAEKRPEQAKGEAGIDADLSNCVDAAEV
jgi:hypothetical protein